MAEETFSGFLDSRLGAFASARSARNDRVLGHFRATIFLDKQAKIWQSKFASGSACRDELAGKFPVAGERLPCCHTKRPANLGWARNGESTRSSTVPVWKRKYLWNQWVPCCLRVPMMHLHVDEAELCLELPKLPKLPKSPKLPKIGN